MPLASLDHVNVRTTRLEAMCRFYCEVLGLREGERPEFDFDGAWLYCGERPVIHLVVVSEPPEPFGALRLEHFAFAATGLDEFLERLEDAAVPYKLGSPPGGRVIQIGLLDPDGNRLHVDFPAHERASVS